MWWISARRTQKTYQQTSENSVWDLFNIRLARSIARELMADPNSEYRSLARSVGRLPSLLYLSTLQCHVICFTRNGRRSTNLKLQVRFCSFRPVCLQLEIPGSTPSSSPASCWMLPMARYFCAVTSLPEAIPRNSAKPVFRIWFGTSVCLLDGSYHNPEARG